MPGYALSVLPQHQTLLQDSAIDPEVARERGYVSVDEKTMLLRHNGKFSKASRVPGLLIPLHRADGSVWGHQYRPDAPKADKAGRSWKYETPWQQPGGIDVPPAIRDKLGDLSVPLLVTEGSPQGRQRRLPRNRLHLRAGRVELAGHQRCRRQGGASRLARHSAERRRIVLAFDSDIATKPIVAKALRELAAYLATKGAKVEYLHLPDLGKDKTGLDDYLAAKGADGLWSLVRPEPPAIKEPEPARSAPPAVPAHPHTLSEVDGAALLDQTHAALSRYVILPSAEAADAVVLWIAATHGMQAWHCAPRLDVTSPVKRCGKSRLLDIIEATCHDPLITVNISPAGLVHSIADDPPTLLLDEADTVFGTKAADNHEDLRGIINAGHSRNRPYIRWDPKARERETCPTFAMAALAGIGSLPDTITDRAIVVKMRRRAPGETVDRFRDRRDGKPLKELESISAHGCASTWTSCATRSRPCRWKTARPTPGSRCSRSRTWLAVTGRSELPWQR